MAGADRRRQPRARCCIRCDLELAGTSVPGEVRNVSAGGLGVVADAPAVEQGERVDVVLRPTGASPFRIHALVWHIRAARRTADGKSTRSWGLVLGEASAEFGALVAKLTGPRRPAAARRALLPPLPRVSPAPPSAAPAEPPAAPPLRQFAIRIQQIGKPRTCQVVASGASQEDAVKAALAEVGAGWTVLDARAVA